MNTNDKANPTISAIDLDEAQLEQVSGGPTDYLLELEGIKGKSETRQSPPLTPPGAARL